ncbi:MAG: class I SAM-dependent methyltransferase [Rhodocyclaceae bacterium]|nr:class I SAM-dependent methyltransferase [Rhodocyclaceae bacterium]MCO5097805.1 class I SAM-dependent methyltransferase [Rhodocyclaceae bacterium]
MTIRQHLPAWMKRLVRICVYWLQDTWDLLTGRREAMTPPRMTALIVGSGDFKRIGEEFLGHFIRECGLKPEHKVLEIGAGYGRMAVGLTPYIAGGSYDGIEIIDKAVAWCRDEIATRFPCFRFHHADLRNPYSNPDGSSNASNYHLPFADEIFDFVFLTSVFSHMPPSEIDAYLAEISRVSKPGARSFITYYLLDDYAMEQIRLRRASQPFYHKFEGFLSTSRSTPENTIAIPEGAIRQFYARHEMEIDEPIRYGAWPGRERYMTYQDVVIAHKRSCDMSS